MSVIDTIKKAPIQLTKGAVEEVKTLLIEKKRSSRLWFKSWR